MSACSSSDTTATASDGGSADATSPRDGGPKADTSTADSSTESDAAAGCNAVVNGASESTASTVKGTAPTATGGTIADGTYFQTEFNVYDPAGPAEAPSPSGLKVTLVIKGSLMQSVQELPDGSVATFTETYVIAGTALNRTLSCPKAAPDLSAVYSVSGGTLTIYETDATSGLVAGSVYVKQ